MINIWKVPLRKLFFCLLLTLPAMAYADGERVDIARFSQGKLDGWKTKIFVGESRYVLATIDGRTALHASSNASASGLFRKISIDLRQTPVLHWSWKVDNVLTDLNERTKAGDDYPARIYVIFSAGAAFWNTRAINYVWSSKQPIESNWRNAFTGNTQMIAVQSGSGQTGKWIDEHRNLLADYRRLFGTEPGKLDAVAIMTDTDNTGGAVSAWYGDIWLDSK